MPLDSLHIVNAHDIKSGHSIFHNGIRVDRNYGAAIFGSKIRLVIQLVRQAELKVELIALANNLSHKGFNLAGTKSEVTQSLVADLKLANHPMIFIVVIGNEERPAHHVVRLKAKLGAIHDAGHQTLLRTFQELRILVNGRECHPHEAVRRQELWESPRDLFRLLREKFADFLLR